MSANLVGNVVALALVYLVGVAAGAINSNEVVNVLLYIAGGLSVLVVLLGYVWAYFESRV